MSALKKFAAKRGFDLPEEQQKRVSTVAIRHGNHVLMGKRRDNGKWTTPGGHLESGEDFHQGALREVEEESGIKLEPHHIKALGGPKEVTKPDGEKLQVHGFVADMDERPATSMRDDPDAEVHRWQWVDVSKGLPDHIKKDLHVPLHDNVLRAALGDHHQEETMKPGSNLHKYMKHKGMKPEEYMPEQGHDVEHDMGADHDDSAMLDHEATMDQEEGKKKRGHRGGY